VTDSNLRYVLVDVFADRPLAGNPLAVFPDAMDLDEATLQLVSREMDHAATAFLFPVANEGAAFRLRIFSREREIPFAGHPALGAHYVHATESRRPLVEPITRVIHEGKDGLFEVELVVEHGRIGQLRLTQRPPEIGPKLTSDEVADVAEALGLVEEEIQATNQPVRVASTGLPVLIVPVATLPALFAARPRYDLLRGLLEGRDATLVYAFTKETRDAHAAAHARAFDTVGSVEVPGARGGAGGVCGGGRARGVSRFAQRRHDPARDGTARRAGSPGEPAVDYLHGGPRRGGRDRARRHGRPRGPCRGGKARDIAAAGAGPQGLSPRHQRGSSPPS
jgi:trans-2,3-dihydro-3-hydroxyanthranilate isomerase